MQLETISSISTPVGEGAIAIVRLSGVDAVEIADRLYKGAKPRISLKSIAMVVSTQSTGCSRRNAPSSMAGSTCPRQKVSWISSDPRRRKHQKLRTSRCREG